LIFNISKF